MEVHIEALLELISCPKPPNFGVEAYIEAPTGVALRRMHKCMCMYIYMDNCVLKCKECIYICMHMHTKRQKMEISPRIEVYLIHYLGCLVDYGVCSADIVQICMVDSVCTSYSF
jgi:hypothetical protein